MQKNSSSFFFFSLCVLLALLFVAKASALAMEYFLPEEGLSYQERLSYIPKYQRVDFRSMLIVESKRKKNLNKKSHQNTNNIKNMLLKGLYGNETRGMAIVALKKAPKKTTVVAVGEEFLAYTLQRTLSHSVVFTKDDKEYILHMPREKKVHTAFIRPASETQTTRSISRKELNTYKKKGIDIWKDISFEPLQKGEHIEGFKVKHIKANSKLATLGLEKEDIIVQANNIQLKSYKDVLDIYKNIDTIQTLRLHILRDKQEKELYYTIE